MARLRKGDLVHVRSGADAGKRGRVLRVIPASHRAVVEGVNLHFKHMRKSPKNPQGGRVEKEAPLDMSRLMLVDPSSDLPTRIGWRFEGGRKVRVARRTGTPIDAPRAAAQAKGAKGRAAEKAPRAKAED